MTECNCTQEPSDSDMLIAMELMDCVEMAEQISKFPSDVNHLVYALATRLEAAVMNSVIHYRQPDTPENKGFSEPKAANDSSPVQP